MSTSEGGDVPKKNDSAGLLADGQSSAPAVVGDVPREPLGYQHRDDLMGRLRSHGPGICVLGGPRGAGATQLAAAYARECVSGGWRLVAWINGEDTASLLAGLAVVADRLGIHRAGRALDAIGAEVRERLEADGDRCLIVFSAVSDPDAVWPYLPSAGRSQVIVTSVKASLPALGTPVPVDVFSLGESLDFLAARTGLAATEQAAVLAEELGCLPLALAQAPVVIKASGLGYDTYLTRLRGYPAQPSPIRAAGGPYPRLVAESILLSTDAVTVADGTGLCAALLGVICLLSPGGVRRGLLRQGATGEVFGAPAQMIDEALASLAEASLLTFCGDEQDPLVTAHRLTMGVTVERAALDGTLTELGAKACVLLAAGAEALGEPRRHRAEARDLVGQVLALTRHVARLGPAGSGPLSAALLASRGWALRCLIELGDTGEQAIELGEALVADRARLLGDDHQDTVAARQDLASAYRGAGRPAQAVPLLERTVADLTRELGGGHQDTVKSRDSLAVAYWAAGRHDEAVTLLERTLADQVRLFGDAHPDTLTTRNNLASAYWVAGRAGEAALMFEQALTGFEQLLGAEHPDVEIVRENLALARADADAARPGRSRRRFGRMLRRGPRD